VSGFIFWLSDIPILAPPSYEIWKILLGDFNAKVGRENIFQPTIGTESVHPESNDNGLD
jgi:hypothetical protein